MLASLTPQIYSTLERLSIFFFSSFLFQSQLVPHSPFSIYRPPRYSVPPKKKGVILAIYLGIHLTQAVFQPLHFHCTYICHVK